MLTSITERPVQTRADAVMELVDGLVRFNRVLKARGGDWGQSVALSRGDVFALGVLEARGSMRAGHLATATAVAPSVVSRQLAVLDAAGLVSRTPDPADGRAELVSITDRGRDRLHTVRVALAAALADRLDGWGADDLTRAAAVVDALTQRLNPPAATKEAHV